MNIDYTPDTSSRSYRAGALLSRLTGYGAAVTFLLVLAKVTIAPFVPWLLVFLPFAVPASLGVVMFALLGVLIAMTIAEGMRK